MADREIALQLGVPGIAGAEGVADVERSGVRDFGGREEEYFLAKGTEGRMHPL